MGMRIGEVSARAGVSPRALRYYEEQGLLDAERSVSGQRHYDDGAVDRVQLIQRLYAAGLNSQTVGELLPCVHTGIATPAMLDRLEVQRDRVDRQAHELLETRDRLDRVIAVARANQAAPAASAAA